ncbi:MAG TPA: SbmA/BacA-like family transporter [Xanthobacteraceae bacterium]|nr:SbmA/BacA-like family transporter [Xanthobacteraceae bacterium]
MDSASTPESVERQLLVRFWRSASRFWRGSSGWVSWSLTALLILIVIAQLSVQYRLNFWNRDFFNALERRDGAELWAQGLLFVPLVAASVTLAILSVWGRMTAQRKWRESLTSHVIEYWSADHRYLHIGFRDEDPKNPEYRVAEDIRIATDAPIDLSVGLLSALLTAIVFINILWGVGGSLAMVLFGWNVFVPAYLVIGVVLYAGVFTNAMRMVGRNLVHVIEDKNQAEAELIAAATQLRDGNEPSLPGRPTTPGGMVRAALVRALARWRQLCVQLMRTTLISQANTLLAPVVGLLLCLPKYMAGDISFGEVMQAGAAFVVVQAAFNWLVDNYQRVADWLSSVNRVARLLLLFDQLSQGDEREPSAPLPVVERESLKRAAP